MNQPHSLPGRPHDARIPFWAPAALGFLLMAIPTLFSTARQSWSTEAGTHQPIVLATGIWLLYHNGLHVRDARRGAGSTVIAAMLLATGWAIYVFGRAYGFLFLEAGAVFGVFIVLLYLLFGAAELRRQAFPLFYLAFAVPLPGWALGYVTRPLQTVVSWASTNLAAAAGYPVAREGVTLFVAQYQLLVEDACSGLNSLVGLVAISLFYIYVVHRSSWRHALLLTAFVIPIAIFVNILRVTAIILIVFYFGDEVAQGILHATTGMVLFGLALALVFFIDWLLSRGRRTLGPARSGHHA
jgi:exosortase